MPVKQIQLRGISRTPSDRMTADGGLADAVNVHLEEGEQAPTLPPDDITEQYFRTDCTGMGLFIHKGLGYDNLIFLCEGNPDDTIMAAPKDDGNILTLFTLNTGEKVKQIKSVGNTLVFCTSQRMTYVLYKDNEYKNLGEQIPIPAVEFRVRQYPTNSWETSINPGGEESIILIESFHRNNGNSGQGASVNGQHSGGSSGAGSVSSEPHESYDKLKAWNLGTWENYFNQDPATIDTYKESYAEIVNDVWDMIKSQTRALKLKGYFGAPFFARYAIRLYDGSYTYQSVPILLGAGSNDFFTAKGSLSANHDPRTGEIISWMSSVSANISNAYKVKAFLSEYNYNGWEDIVKSIDIFISTDIYTPLLNSPITGIDANGETSFTLLFSEEDEDIEKETRLEELLSKVNFYRIASIAVNNTSKLESGYDLLSKKQLISDDELNSQDILVEQPELPDDYLSFHKKIADGLYQYNNKVIMTGLSQEITTGYPFFNGSVVIGRFVGVDANIEALNRDRWYFKYAFYLRDSSNDSLIVLGRTPENKTVFESTYHYKIEDRTESHEHYSRPFAWLAYPDPRCYQVDIAYRQGRDGDWNYVRYKMEPHPGLQCSFLFLGLDKPLGLTPSDVELPEDYAFPTEEKRLLKENNIIWASVINNPFVFPVEGRLSFHSEVVSLANATRALSEGQFGQFPIYVFTKDGIWSVPISDEGNFLASVPMSRDVALSKDSIQALEQAIVFVTAQGVMLLQGSSIENISPYMNGLHYVLDEDVKQLLARGEWKDLTPICEDKTTFMGFINGSKIAYDYVGRRIIFFRDKCRYQYVYYISTGTWHKLSGASWIYQVLNSYPDCYVTTVSEHRKYQIFDYSTVLDEDYRLSDAASPVRGIIITRPFNLEEADVRKVIRQVRIRGKFNRNDVQYILLGSFDDIHWKRLHSLRGGSYKQYRMIIVFNLSPTERISWVDIDYESRFTNKLR